MMGCGCADPCANGVCQLADGPTKSQKDANNVRCFHRAPAQCAAQATLTEQAVATVQVQRKLILALILALCFMVVEVVGGIMANR